MRSLNEFEQSIIDRIVDYHITKKISPNFIAILDHLIENININLDYKNRAVEIQADIKFYDDSTIIEVVQRLNVELLVMVNLIKLLEVEGYISTYLQATPEENSTFGRLIVGNKFITYQIVDKDLIEKILNYSYKTILVDESLLQFVKNNYRSDSKKKSDRNIKIAIYSIVISSVIGLIGLYFSYESNKEKPLRIHEESINKITEPIKEITNTNQKILIGIDTLTKTLDSNFLESKKSKIKIQRDIKLLKKNVNEQRKEIDNLQNDSIN
ncbi:hypothetical protein OAQ99_04665 [Candidatus Kapabacteria bacterium]|nr:hypothetical protein [Candidatus Kapabacteria bacterium]